MAVARERLSGFLCLVGRHAVVDRSPARIVVPGFVALGVFDDADHGVHPHNIGRERAVNTAVSMACQFSTLFYPCSPQIGRTGRGSGKTALDFIDGFLEPDRYHFPPDGSFILDDA